MDTRGKIVAPSEAMHIAQSATVISGYFDPLLAWHASRLQELRNDLPLLVLIASPANPILPSRARAELVAGLKVVDHVCEAANGIAPHFRLEEEEGCKMQELIERVHARHL